MKAFFLLSIVLMFFSCQTEPTHGQRTQKQYATSIPQLTQVQYTYEDTIQGYRMEIQLPALHNNPEFSAIVNQSLEENKAHFENFIRDFGRLNNVMTSEYEVVQLTDSIVSIRQDYVWAVPGTSVLQYYFGHINFQPATNKRVWLKDLFREGVDYRTLVIATLKEKIAEEYDVQRVSINEDDLNAFVIGADFIEFSKVLYPEVMEARPLLVRVPFSDWKEELAW